MRFAAMMMVLLLLNGCSVTEQECVTRARTALGLDGISLRHDHALHTDSALTVLTTAKYYSHNDLTNLRQEALVKLSTAPGWHMEPVEAEQVDALVGECCPGSKWESSATYEAWYFCADGKYPDTIPRGKPPGSWTLGFYDADAGIWLYMDNSDEEGV